MVVICHVNTQSLVANGRLLKEICTRKMKQTKIVVIFPLVPTVEFPRLYSIGKLAKPKDKLSLFPRWIAATLAMKRHRCQAEARHKAPIYAIACHQPYYGARENDLQLRVGNHALDYLLDK